MSDKPGPCQNDKCIMFDKAAVMGINCLDGFNFPCRLHSAKPSEWISAIDRCLKQAESMIGSPTEDDLQKFIDWLRDEYPLPPPPAETP